MRIDIIVASRNGAAKLRKNLPKYPVVSLARHGVRLILIDSASHDETFEVMRQFAAATAMNVIVRRLERPGLALAQNAGLDDSDAEVVVFTDDDCFPDACYAEQLLALFDLDRFQYGAGEVIPIDRDADPRVANTAWWRQDREILLPPGSMIVPGMGHGANMFFSRSVLERIGNLQPLGRRMHSDIMTFYLASAAGFTGAMLRGPKVYHDHGIARDSAAADATSRRYDRTRGAYYAEVIARGDLRAFDVWKASAASQTCDPEKLRLEFLAAAEALAARSASAEGGGSAAPSRRPSGWDAGSAEPAVQPSATPEPAPALSIVICTRDRYHLLRGAIAAVERQTADAGRFELIVVDNSSDVAAQASFLAGLTVDCRCDYAIETLPGAARARNIGARLARGDVVAFLDDDAVADPHWAEVVLARFAADASIAVLGGPVMPIWPGERPAWLPPEMHGLLTVVDHGPEPHALAAHEWLVSANLAFRKEALTAAGGFPEGLGRRGSALLSNEDLAAVRNVVAAGHQAFYDPRMLVRHHVHPERLTQGWLRRRVAWQVVSDLADSGGPAPAVGDRDLTALRRMLEDGSGPGTDIACLWTERQDAAGVLAQLQAVALAMRMLLCAHAASET